MPVKKNGFWVPSGGEGKYSLPQRLKNQNATVIYNYFLRAGWAPRAIYSMLGNMDVESRMNPEVLSGQAFGLVQWDPRTKLDQWARQAGLSGDTSEGFVQCGVILWQQQTETGWDRHDETDITFTQWAHDNTLSFERSVHLFRWLFEVADPGTEEERTEWARYYSLHVPAYIPPPYWLLFKFKQRRKNKHA